MRKLHLLVGFACVLSLLGCRDEPATSILGRCVSVDGVPCVASRCSLVDDDDGDGLIGCDDPDCAHEPACVGACDHDPGGNPDCADPGCADDPGCDGTCSQDAEGNADCEDPDCADDPDCDGTCSQDAEGNADCEDPDCGAADGCPDGTCGEDAEGNTDCEDPDCGAADGCPDGTCSQDAEGNADCEDPDCGAADGCPDGTCSQDADGNTDCDDPDCSGSEECDDTCEVDDQGQPACGDPDCADRRECRGCDDPEPTRDPGESDESFSQRRYAWECAPCRVASCGDLKCARHDLEYQLLHSRYPVPGWSPVPFGYHQGLGIRMLERIVDRRDGKVCSDDRDLDGDGVADVLRKSMFMFKYVWNHGNTVNTTPGQYAVMATKTTAYNFWDKDDGAAANDREWNGAQSLQQCLRSEEDGFCDRLCANDGYTLPPADLDPALLVWTPPWWLTPKSQHPLASQIVAGTSGWLSTGTPVPRYGHNSNNDANAFADYFGRCGTDVANSGAPLTEQEWLRASAPSVCAQRCDSAGNMGCLSMRNIALSDAFATLAVNTAPGDLPKRQPSADCWNRVGGACGTAIGAVCPFVPGKVVNGM